MNILFYVHHIIPGLDALNGNIKFTGDQRQGLALSNPVFEFTNLIGLLANRWGLGRGGDVFLEDL